MSFGKNVAWFRKEKGLTQENLVKKSGVAISQIRRYETDKSSPTLDVITKLAKALGVSIDERDGKCGLCQGRTDQGYEGHDRGRSFG